MRPSDLTDLARRVAGEKTRLGQEDGFLRFILLNFGLADSALDVAALDVRRRMEGVLEHLDADGGGINPLGELQGAGPDLDRLCAERAVWLRVLESYMRDRYRGEVEAAARKE